MPKSVEVVAASEPLHSIYEAGRIIASSRKYADRQKILDAFRLLRETAPVCRLEPKGYKPFWVLSRYADVLEASRQNEQFRYVGNDPILGPLSIAKGKPPPVNTLVTMEAPEHGKYRKLTQSWFQPKNLRNFEQRLHESAVRSIERVKRLGEGFDSATELSIRYPLNIIMSILGVPERDEAQMLKWSQHLLSEQDPDLRSPPPDGPIGSLAYKLALTVLGEATPRRFLLFAAMREMISYYKRLTKERRSNPTDDLASVLSNAVIDGKPIGNLERYGYYLIIATAGHDTTAAAISSAIEQLARDPALFKRLKQNPDPISAFIDEVLRFETPVQHFMRTAGPNAEVGGIKIPEGDWVMVSYLAANFDPEAFSEPESFNIDRKGESRHLAFGYGPHVCLGQHLARIEMKILFEELISRIDAICLSGNVRRIESNFVTGAKRMPVNVHWTAA